MTRISDEQKQALAKHPGQPLPVEHPDTLEQFVLVKMDLFQQMQRAANYDEADPSPAEFAPMLREVMKEDWDTPGMEIYDNYQPPKYDVSKDAT